MNPPTTLFKNALIVPNAPGQPAAFWGWLLVSGNRIEAVGDGKTPAAIAADQVIDAGERAMLPGLVNTHAHSHSSLSRGSAEGLLLHEWLPIVEKEQRELTEEQAYTAALATYSEAVLNGTTLISDMCLFPRAAMRAAREVGIRVVVAPYTASTKPFTPDLSLTEALLASLPPGEEKIKVWVGLHDLETCGDEQVSAGASLARRYQTGIHIHCSETRFSVEETLARTGRRPVAHLARLGLLATKTLLAHCVWVDETDRRLMAENRVKVAHCPHANLKLGSGIAPVPEMLADNISVTLATDGAKANNRLDMFDVMKFASLIHKGTHLDPNTILPGTILDMATRAGYDAFELSAGSLSPGMLADLILVNLEQFHLQPALPETIVANLVHAARGSDVELVMVDGRILVKDGELLSVNRHRILAELKSVAKNIFGESSRPAAQETD